MQRSENRDSAEGLMGSYIVYTVLPIVGSHRLLKVTCSPYTVGSTTTCSLQHHDDDDG